jgi:hypothetical protein
MGNTTSNRIEIGGIQVDGTASIAKNLTLYSTLTDKLGSTGSNGYVLTATNSGVEWMTPYIPSLNQATNMGNTTSNRIEIGGIQVDGTASIAKNLTLYSTLTDKLGSTGSNGYVLTATHSGVEWMAPYIPSLNQTIIPITFGTSRTISGAYNNTTITVNTSSPFTINLISNSDPGNIGGSINIIQLSLPGNFVSITADPSVTLYSLNTFTKLSGQNALATLTLIALNTWVLSGNISH